MSRLRMLIDTLDTQLRYLGFRGALKLSFILALLMVTAVALDGQNRLPDNPSYRSVSTNLLNPYTTWCVWKNGQVIATYGASWAHWGGPYSIMWYWFNHAITLGGVFSYTWTLFAINLWTVWKLRGRTWLQIPWAFTSCVTVLALPQNMLIFYLILLGFYSRWGLLLSPVFKLPFGAPVPVWKFAFQSSASFNYYGNWYGYVWLGIFWLSALIYQVHYKSNSPKNYQQ